MTHTSARTIKSAARRATLTSLACTSLSAALADPLLSAGVAAALFAAPAQLFAATPGEVQIGERLRDAAMQGLNGPIRKLSEFRGKPLIINVWASWCGPCKAEMASLERLAWHDVASRLRVIGISTDDYPEKARELLVRTNATITHFIDQRLVLEHMLGATQLPLTVLVDADGRVLEKIVGARQWDDARSLQLIAKTFRLKPPRNAGAG